MGMRAPLASAGGRRKGQVEACKNHGRRLRTYAADQSHGDEVRIQGLKTKPSSQAAHAKGRASALARFNRSFDFPSCAKVNASRAGPLHAPLVFISQAQ